MTRSSKKSNKLAPRGSSESPTSTCTGHGSTNSTTSTKSLSTSKNKYSLRHRFEEHGEFDNEMNTSLKKQNGTLDKLIPHDQIEKTKKSTYYLHTKPTLAEHIHLPSSITTPYILHHYRVAHEYFDCIYSMFTLHNQTINLWIHFIGFFYFVYDAFLSYNRLLSRGTTQGEIIVTCIFYTCACFQMLFSTLYHTFGSGVHGTDGEARHNFWLKLDLIGIVLMVFGSFLIGLYHGFICVPTKMTIYLVCASSFLLLGAVFTMIDDIFHIDLQTNLRTASLSLAVIFGIIPTGEWFLTDGLTLPDNVKFGWLRGTIGMFLYYFLGFLFFIFRFPECYAPGRFDLVGASHQFWHLFVWAAGAEWAAGMVAISDWRAEQMVNGQLCIT